MIYSTSKCDRLQVHKYTGGNQHEGNAFLIKYTPPNSTFNQVFIAHTDGVKIRLFGTGPEGDVKEIIESFTTSQSSGVVIRGGGIYIGDLCGPNGEPVTSAHLQEAPQSQEKGGVRVDNCRTIGQRAIIFPGGDVVVSKSNEPRKLVEFKLESKLHYIGECNGTGRLQRSGVGLLREQPSPRFLMDTIGEWHNGLATGFAVERSMQKLQPEVSFNPKDQDKKVIKEYSGRWQNGQKSGAGIMFDQFGDRYKGRWHGNKMHGAFTLQPANGSPAIPLVYRNNYLLPPKSPQYWRLAHKSGRFAFQKLRNGTQTIVRGASKGLTGFLSARVQGMGFDNVQFLTIDSSQVQEVRSSCKRGEIKVCSIFTPTHTFPAIITSEDVVALDYRISKTAGQVTLSRDARQACLPRDAKVFALPIEFKNSKRRGICANFSDGVNILIMKQFEHLFRQQCDQVTRSKSMIPEALVGSAVATFKNWTNESVYEILASLAQEISQYGVTPSEYQAQEELYKISGYRLGETIILDDGQKVIFGPNMYYKPRPQSQPGSRHQETPPNLEEFCSSDHGVDRKLHGNSSSVSTTRMKSSPKVTCTEPDTGHGRTSLSGIAEKEAPEKPTSHTAKSKSKHPATTLHNRA